MPAETVPNAREAAQAHTPRTPQNPPEAPPQNPRSARSTADVPPPEAVTPLIRGITVLRRLTEAGGTLSPSALERSTGLARSTVDRVTGTLARMGYVRLDGRDVVLAPHVMELGNAYLAALRLPTLLDARADALADELDESVSLAVADRDGIRFIHQATRRRALSLSFRIGDLLPAERTAPGPLFAADWTSGEWADWRARRAADPGDTTFPAVPPRPTSPGAPFDDGEHERGEGDEGDEGDEEFVRRTARAAADGWALDDQLIEPGLVAVSVPVRDPDTRRVLCVASVVSHTSRHTAADLRATLLPRLRTAVTEIETALRSAPPAASGPHPSGLAAWTTASKQELGREFVESLARGLTVLTAFGEGRAALTLTEIAKATGLARATARRALITYAHLGLVTTPMAPPHTFALTPRVLSLGFPPLSRTTLPRLAAPHLDALAQRLNEPTALAILLSPDTSAGTEPQIQYTAGAAAPRVLTVDITLGTRLPAHVTALGRVLLADAPPDTLGPDLPGTDLAGIRARGYALADEELESGLRAIAVPIRDRAGRTVAAVNVATHAARRTLDDCVTQLLPELTATATLIQTDLHTASRFTPVPLT
jgi:IclR family pca regulon transcriptional regulator